MKHVDPRRGQSGGEPHKRHGCPLTPTLVLLSLVLLAFALRVTRLGAQSLWYDEGVTAQVAAQGLAELTRWTAGDIQPPLYYYVLAGWIRLAGRSEWALRFPSACFGVLTVPLLYALGRRLFDRQAALLAALLATLSSLYVYYAQEARMYTLLTFLGALAAYLLLRIQIEERATRRRGLWVAFALIATAALYTHYFAAFLLVAFALYFLIGTLHAPRPTQHVSLPEGLIAFLAIALAYTPWLPAVLTRLRQDASYWRGTLKLDEALRHVLISFSLGETVLEPVAVRLMWGFVAILGLSTLALFWYHTSRITHHASRITFQALVFPLSYLLVPLALILLLSYRNPKFNPRYLMLASPAFFLLIAGGLSKLLSSPYPLTPYAARGIVIFCLAYIIGSSACSIHNWFTDPAFTKADFRGVARYVREHIAPDETVILTSGHLSPVWDTYAPDIERYRVPDIDILDVNATLGYHTADDLNRILAGRRGVWTVLWQDDVVDPNGFLHDFLRRAGQEQPVERSFWHVGLRHYRLPEGVRFSSEPPIEHPLQANFGGQVALLGWSQEEAATVTLYWQALADTERDFKVALALEDAEGHTWGRADLRPAAYIYPTFRWRPGEVLFGRYELPAEPGTPPGDYRLRVGLYDEADLAGLDVLDEAGNARGKRVSLDGVRLSRLAEGDALAVLLALPGSRQTDSTLTEGLRLLGYAFDPAPLRPGDERTLTAVWQAETALPEVTVRWRWLDEAGHVLAEDAFLPGVQGQPGYPTSGWQVGDVVRSQTTLFLSPQAVAGKVTLELMPFVSGEPAGEPLLLLDVAVELPERAWEVPVVQFPVDAQFEFLVRLVGIDLGAEAVLAGTTLPVTVTWQAVGDLASWDLTGFVHLLGSDGRVVAQEDHVPQRGQRPTRGWLPGEVVSDRYDLSLPAGLPPGLYGLEIGLYLDDGRRLRVTAPQAWQGRDSVLVGEIWVE
ncbi:MAG: glycosyltransferase family 39 protein [Anaerolineae bacterium]|nr:glycosyltransferase family 39 protein [Anaerolineae bacterium]